MFRAFSANDDLSSKHIHEAILSTVPMSRFAKESIQDLRDWCKNRTVPASIADTKDSSRKIKM
jgi:hypothetical protein